MKIIYEKRVVKVDLPKIDTGIKGKIQSALNNKLLLNPSVYSIPLKGTLKPLRKFRVGSYRIIHTITNNTIKIYAIIHRDNVYKKSEKIN